MKLNLVVVCVFVGMVTCEGAVPAAPKAVIPKPVGSSKNPMSPEAARLLKNMGAAQVRAFSVDNLLIDGIPKDGHTIWFEALKDMDLFVKSIMAKKTKIKEATKKRFVSVMDQITKLSEKFFKIIDNLRAVSFNFKKEKYADFDAYWQGKIIFDYDKEIIAGLTPDVKALKGLQQGLGKETFDSQDALEVKKLLTFLASALELAYNKVIKDFNTIKADIHAAIKQKRFETQGYANADGALQAINSAVPRFSPDNFFISGISADGKGVWSGLLNGIQLYLNNQIPKLDRRLSSDSKDLYLKNMKIINDISDQLINDVTLIRDSNAQFKQGISKDAWEKAKQQVDKLIARIKELEKVEESVKPNTQDSPSLKDLKNVIKTLSLYLKATVKKVGSDLSKVVPLSGAAVPTLPVANKPLPALPPVTRGPLPALPPKK